MRRHEGNSQARGEHLEGHEHERSRNHMEGSYKGENLLRTGTEEVLSITKSARHSNAEASLGL